MILQLYMPRSNPAGKAGKVSHVLAIGNSTSTCHCSVIDDTLELLVCIVYLQVFNPQMFLLRYFSTLSVHISPCSHARIKHRLIWEQLYPFRGLLRDRVQSNTHFVRNFFIVNKIRYGKCNG